MLPKSILLLVLPLTVLGGVLEPRAIPWGTPSRPYRDGPGDAPGRLPPPVRPQPVRAHTEPTPPTVEPVKKPAQRKNAGTQQADVHRMSEGNSIALFNGKPVDPNTGNLIIKNTNEKRAFPVYQSANGQIYSHSAEEQVEIPEAILEKHTYTAFQLPNGQIFTPDVAKEVELKSEVSTLEKRNYVRQAVNGQLYTTDEEPDQEAALEKRAFPVWQSANGQVYTNDGDKEVELQGEEKNTLEKHNYAQQAADGSIYTTSAASPARAQKRDLRKKLNLDFLSSPDTDEDAMHGHLRSGDVGQFQAPGTDRRPIDYNGYSDPAYAAYQPYPDGYYPAPGHQKSTAHAEEEEEEVAEEQQEEIEELPEAEIGPEQIEWKGRSITVFNGQPVQGAAKKKALDIISKRGLDSGDAHLGPNDEVSSAPARQTVEFEPYLIKDCPLRICPYRRKVFMQPHLVPTVQEQTVQEPHVHVVSPMDPYIVLTSEVDPPHRRVQPRDLWATLDANGNLQMPSGWEFVPGGGARKSVKKEKAAATVEKAEKLKTVERRDNAPGRYYKQHANGQVYDVEEENTLEKRNYVQQAVNGQLYTTDEELDQESALPHLHARDFKSRLRNNGSGRKKGVSSDNSESVEESEDIESAVASAPEPVAEPTLEDLANGQSFVIRNGVPIEAGKNRNVRVKKPRPAFPARGGQVDGSVIKRSTNPEAAPGKKIPNLNPFGRNPITRNKGKDNNSSATEKTNGNTNSETTIGEARVVRSPNSQENEHVKVNKGKDYVLFNGQPVSVGGGVPGAKGGESAAKSMPGLAGRVGPL